VPERQASGRRMIRALAHRARPTWRANFAARPCKARPRAVGQRHNAARTRHTAAPTAGSNDAARKTSRSHARQASVGVVTSTPNSKSYGVFVISAADPRRDDSCSAGLPRLLLRQVSPAGGENSPSAYRAGAPSTRHSVPRPAHDPQPNGAWRQALGPPRVDVRCT
jgi:hypothetical protein